MVGISSLITLVASVALFLAGCALQMPAVPPPISVDSGPLVAMAMPIDARSNQGIATMTMSPRPPLDVLDVIPGPDLYKVGPEIATHARDLMANQLSAQGFRIVQNPAPQNLPASRSITVAVTRARVHADKYEILERLREGYAVAELRVDIEDDSHHQLFSKTYSGKASGSEVSAITRLKDFPHYSYEMDVSNALSDAIAKATSDREFIAAINPP